MSEFNITYKCFLSDNNYVYSNKIKKIFNYELYFSLLNTDKYIINDDDNNDDNNNIFVNIVYHKSCLPLIYDKFFFNDPHFCFNYYINSLNTLKKYNIFFLFLNEHNLVIDKELQLPIIENFDYVSDRNFEQLKNIILTHYKFIIDHNINYLYPFELFVWLFMRKYSIDTCTLKHFQMIQKEYISIVNHHFGKKYNNYFNSKIHDTLSVFLKKNIFDIYDLLIKFSYQWSKFTLFSLFFKFHTNEFEKYLYYINPNGFNRDI